MSLIVKIILLGLSLALSLPFSDKRQYFAHLRFISNFQLINVISSDLKNLLKYFNDTALVAFFTVLLALFGVG